MCAMRIGEITGSKYLMRFYSLQKFCCDLYIFITHWFLFNRTRLIKGEIEKMNVLIFDANIATRSFSFASSYQTFDVTDLCSIHLVCFFLRQIFLGAR